MKAGTLAPTVRDLLAGADERAAPLRHDGKSGAQLERIVVDGTAYVVKRTTLRNDVLRRLSHDQVGRSWLVWSSGLLADVPEVIDSVVVTAERRGTDVTLVLRDVGGQLVPDNDEPLPLAQHLGFLDHMAQLAAAFWGWEDTVGGYASASRYGLFAPAAVRAELRRHPGAPLVADAARGWALLQRRVPKMAAVVLRLLDADATPLTAALATTPQVLIHGDWKCANLGSREDGRTILLDWALWGRAAVCAELAWYLALNVRRLPQSKDATIGAYRDALERHGVDTAAWFDLQVELALLGAMLWFGWTKASDDEPELEWWARRVELGARRLREARR